MGKWIAIGIAAFIGLSLVIGACNYLGSWGDKAQEVVSPDNVERQNTNILDDWEAMQAQAGNLCGAKDSQPQEGDPTLLEDPLFAEKAVYRKVRADYNRRMGNLYEAQAVRKLPLPSNLKGLPERAPLLEDMVEQVCG